MLALVQVQEVQDHVSLSEGCPFLLTQNAITEMFKHVIGFCALKCGDAINIAISLESPET